MTWKPGKAREPSQVGQTLQPAGGSLPHRVPGAWIPRSCSDREPCPSDPCAFSSPRLCKVPESKQHSWSSWNQSGAVSTGIEIQLTLPSTKAPAVQPLPPSHQPSTWTLGPLAVPSALPTSGHPPRSHALQPSFLWRSEGPGQEAGEPRPLSLSSAAPGSPERSALETESKAGGLLPGLLPHRSPSRAGAAGTPQDQCLGLASAQGPTCITAHASPFLEAFSHSLNSSVCLSVHPTPRPAKNKAVRGARPCLLVCRELAGRGSGAHPTHRERRPHVLQLWLGMQVVASGARLAASAGKCPPRGVTPHGRARAAHLRPGRRTSPALLSWLPRPFFFPPCPAASDSQPCLSHLRSHPASALWIAARTRDSSNFYN